MPAQTLASIAKKTGLSLAKVERYWIEAKKEAAKKFDKDSDSYWKYVVGIVKQRAGVSESLAESLIDAKVEQDDMCIRVFRDLNGEVSFATLEDVCIDANSDARLALIHRLANEFEWPSTHSFPEDIEGYEGSVQELTQRVISSVYAGFGIYRER